MTTVARLVSGTLIERWSGCCDELRWGSPGRPSIHQTANRLASRVAQRLLWWRMLENASALAGMLAEGRLASRTVYVIELPRSGERVLSVPVRPACLLEEWSAARELVPRTGRWPVAATSWGGGPLPPTLETFWIDPRGERPPPPEIRAAAREIPESRAIDEIWDEQPTFDWLSTSWLEWELRDTRARCGSAPDLESVTEALNDRGRERHRWSHADGRPTINDLEWLLFQWEEQRAPASAPQRADADDWFVPGDGEVTHLLFLPTPRGPDSIAYLDFDAVQGGVAGVTAPRLIAVMSDWERRYGAELVANWGTMLQFVVRRPPDALADAWELAVDLDLIGPSDNGYARHVRDLARFLWRRPTWFVHCRP